jgi:aspartyl-tRNA synthetase
MDSMGSLARTHHCGRVTAGATGQSVTVTGWVDRLRDHGGIYFVDVRDWTGIVQVVFHPDEVSADILAKARDLAREYVVAVQGVVADRPADMVNSNLATGAIEIVAKDLRVLNISRTPPFAISDDVEASEDLRLKYRYLDLRRPSLQESLRLRNRVTLEVRRFLNGEGFCEVETPMLVRPTPEGARDYLVPARLHRGKFYALPQSPQLYKQILMVAGFDRYFQLARCLRDEDLRADRQPEHTQIDIEMSFVREDDVFTLIEGMMSHLFERVLDVRLTTPFPRLTYREAMDRYGSDKPDTRFGLEMVDLTALGAGSDFQVFKGAVEAGGAIYGLRLPGGAAKSRKDIDDLTEKAKLYGAKGLAWTKVTDAGFEGGSAKFLDAATLRPALRAEPGDLLLFVADARRDTAAKSLGAVRTTLGEPLIKGRENEFNFLWVREFPLFEPTDDGGWTPAHHIFSMPIEEHLDFLESDPGKVHAQLYDLVANGVEMASVSIRIHRRDIQERVMKVIGLSLEEAERRFGFLLEAFQYGAPPHGGIAPGLDRLIMVMTGRRSIRDVIAFPKTQSATSLMDGCPAEVDEKDVRDLHLKIVKEGS